MKIKKVVGTKDLDKLRFTLKDIEEQLKENIEIDSKRVDDLVKQYKRIKELIKEGEEEIEVAKRLEDERTRIKAEREVEEKERLIKDIIEARDKRIKVADERKQKIDEQLAALYYKKEDILQNMKFLKNEIADVEEKMETARERGNVPLMNDAREEIQENKKIMQELDRNFSKLTARIAIAEKRKTVINKAIINEISEIIIDYNRKADEYGVERVDLISAIRERRPENEMAEIEGNQQGRYSLDRNYLCRGFEEDERKKLEEESKLRLQKEKENSLPVRMIRATSRGIRKVTSAIIGGTKLVGQTILKNAKGIWTKLKSKVNDAMIKSTDSLIKRLEQDADTYQKRKEKFDSAIKCNINEENAINRLDQNSEQEQNKERIEIKDEQKTL